MIMKYKDWQPKIHASCFVAEDADIIGNVILEQDVSVWFHTVIRGDKDVIHIKEGSNVQDNCTLHTDPKHQLMIGRRVTIGHNAVVHGAIIEDECLVGMGAIILNGAHIGTHSIIAAGALVKEHQVIPENSIAVGCPAKVVKQVSEEQIMEILENAKHYALLGEEYRLVHNDKNK